MAVAMKTLVAVRTYLNLRLNVCGTNPKCRQPKSLVIIFKWVFTITASVLTTVSKGFIVGVKKTFNNHNPAQLADDASIRIRQPNKLSVLSDSNTVNKTH